MGTLQEDLNDIGSNMRELHGLADASGSADLAASAAALHQKLTRGFRRHVRPDHPELDWDAIAGNPTDGKLGGAHTNSGTKHEDGDDDDDEG